MSTFEGCPADCPAIGQTSPPATKLKKEKASLAHGFPIVEPGAIAAVMHFVNSSVTAVISLI